ncbi:MAG TPA: glycosyltransferase [Bacteroidetes bacterium]|nr:glycosyltransferase [Bacteroidota bacterium]
MLDAPWEPLWTILLLIAGSVYLIVLNRVRSGIFNLRVLENARLNRDGLFSVSIIIPCRNEAKHVGAALDDLAAQDYPADLIQVIVVDDRSTDGTGDVARSRRDKLPGLSVLSIESCPANVSPKKNAILRGLREAQGEIIITTDGDCRFQPGWIRSLVSGFAADVGVVTGLTIFDRQGREPLWQRLQQLDYLSHSFFASGAIGSGLAFNCNGSNLALRRQAFEDVGGYEQFRQVITGDDTLLLQKIRRSGKWRIHFSVQPDSLVRSWPEETPKQVLNQRLRWGSGGLSYSRDAMALALSTFVFFLMLFLSPFLLLGGLISSAWLVPLALKIVQEGRVMSAGWKFFGLKPLRVLRPQWAEFALLELIHIPAILTFSIGGHLLGFQWKGERFKRTRTKTVELSGTVHS